MAPSPLALSPSLLMTLHPSYCSQLQPHHHRTSLQSPGAPQLPSPTTFFPRSAPPAEGAPGAGRWESARELAGKADGRWRGPQLGKHEPSDRGRLAAPRDGRVMSVRSAPAAQLPSAVGAARNTCVGRMGGRIFPERVAVTARIHDSDRIPEIQAQKGTSPDGHRNHTQVGR